MEEPDGIKNRSLIGIILNEKWPRKKRKKGMPGDEHSQGKQLTHEKVIEISNRDDVTISWSIWRSVSRVIDEFVDEEISIGGLRS